MMKRAILLWLIVAGTAAATRADSEAPPRPVLTVDRFGQHLFKMLPKSQDKPPRGIMLEVQRDGSLQEVWTVSGWYARRVFLHDSGEFLVRLGNWPRGRQPSHEALGVAFYERDRLLAVYSTADLILDESRVISTVSHHFWLARRWPPDAETPPPPQPALIDGRFTLRTIDGIDYTFNIASGAVVSPALPDTASIRTGQRLEEAEAVARRAGYEIHDAAGLASQPPLTGFYIHRADGVDLLVRSHGGRVSSLDLVEKATEPKGERVYHAVERVDLPSAAEAED